MIQYKPIPEYSGYEVSNNGAVWSYWTKGKGGTSIIGRVRKWIKPFTNKDGHKTVTLRREGIGKTFYIHHLVLNAFVGLCPNGMECCHDDGDPGNNNDWNLRWDTHVNNERDKIRHGTQRKILTDIQIIDIWYHDRTLPQREVAEKFGTSQGTICDIWSGKRHQHLTGDKS